MILNSVLGRRGRLLAGVAAVSLALASPGWAQPQGPVRVDIPQADAASALQSYARQTGVQIFAPAEVLRGVVTRRVQGEYTAEKALALMLEGSGLAASSKDGGKTVTLAPAAASAASAGNEAVGQLDEVVVTANKREENVRKVAGSVTAMTGKQLDQLGAQSFADYLTRTPGVQFNAAMPGLSTVTIRGVSTTTSIDVGQAATGVYLNDIPLTEPFNSAGIPDIDTFDVERVEVLRGPQDTLFGSATLGGAVNYIAAKARPDAFAARVEASTFATASSGRLGYTAKAMVNLPVITDKLAVRVVGTYRETPGYLDNVGVGRKDSNAIDVTGGRLMVEWRPTDRISVSGLSLYSKTHNEDAFWGQPALGELKRSTKLLEPFRSDARINSLRADVDLDFATLTVSGAHTRKTTLNLTDFSAVFGPVFRGLAPPIPLTTARHADGDMFEARLTSKGGGPIEWLVGASHNHIETDLPSGAGFAGAGALTERLFAGAFGAGVGALAAPNDRFTDYKLHVDGVEKALFGEATWRFAPSWRLTAGTRYFDTELENDTVQSGLFTLFSTGQLVSRSHAKSHEDGFTPKVSLTYEPDAEHMYYALVSRGYRFGGPNAIPQSSLYPSPASFGSDSLINYEIGARTAWLDRTLLLDATVYYIDWQDIQLLRVRGDNLAYADNVGGARNIGVDLAATWRPTSHFDLISSVGYLDAKLKDAVDDGSSVTPAGTILPGASRWRAASTAIYRWDGPFKPTTSASYRYVSSAPSDLGGAIRQGGYGVLDLRASGQFGGPRIEGFVENVGDRRGVTVAETSRTGVRQYYVRPRTIGLRVTYDF